MVGVFIFFYVYGIFYIKIFVKLRIGVFVYKGIICKNVICNLYNERILEY